MSELSDQEETILLLGCVLTNYPWVSTELIQSAYIDSFLEINLMSEEEKRSFVDEKIQMMKRLQAASEEK